MRKVPNPVMRAIALALCLLCLLPAGALATAEQTAVVSNPNPADRLNLRAGTQTSAQSLGKYYSGVVVTVLSIDGSGQWAYVRIGDGQRGSAEGYMQTQYLAFGSNGARVQSAIPTYKATSSAWELYDYASTRAAYRMMGIENNVEVLGISGNWYHIRVRNLYGYVPANTAAVPGQTSAAGSTAYVNNPNPSDRLHLRTAPRSTATSLGKYYNGVTVEVLPYDSTTWSMVRIGNTVGYMMTRYLSASSVRSAIPTMTVTNPNPNPNDRLNLRAEMSQQSDSLGKYYSGTKVEVLGIGETWYHVRVDGKIGYMMKQYLK